MKSSVIKVTGTNGKMCIIPWSNVLYVTDQKIVVTFNLRAGANSQDFNIKETAAQVYAQLK